MANMETDIGQPMNNSKKRKYHEEFNVVPSTSFKQKGIGPSRTKTTEKEILEDESVVIETNLQTLTITPGSNNFPKKPAVPAFNSGIRYQLELSMLILSVAVREIRKENNLDFMMSCEDPRGKQFDDIVFRFKIKNEPWVSLFIQAKFTEQKYQMTWKKFQSSSDKSFSIIKYFNSIFDHKKGQKSPKENCNSIFVLCTNIKLHENVVGCMDQFDEKNPLDHVIIQKYFDELSAQLCKFNQNSKDAEAINFYNKIKETHASLLEKTQQKETNGETLVALENKNNETDFIDTFFNIFMIASRTISKDKIKNKILQLSPSMKTFSNSCQGNLANTFINHFRDWVEQWIVSTEGYYLTNLNVLIFLMYFELLSISEYFETELEIKQRNFVNDAWKNSAVFKDLEQCLNNTPENPKLIECIDSPMIAWDVICSFCKDNKNKYLFIDAEYFKKFKDNIMKVFYEIDHSIILAVVCTQFAAYNADDFRIEDNRNVRHTKVMIVIKPNNDSQIKNF